jgi:hypothetical protein
MVTSIGRWTLTAGPEISAQIYAAIAPSSLCNCADCRVFLANPERLMPLEFKRFAATLGFNLAKPASLSHVNLEGDNVTITSGFYHLVGSSQSGADVLQLDGNAGSFHYEWITPGFGYGFGSDVSLLREEFQGYPVVQLEFQPGNAFTPSL